MARDNEAEAVQLAAELPQKHQPLVNKTRYATPASVQMRQLMRRFLLVYWRSPAYNVGPLLWPKAHEQHARLANVFLTIVLHVQMLCTPDCLQVTRMIMTTFISLLYVRHLGLPCVRYSRLFSGCYEHMHPRCQLWLVIPCRVQCTSTRVRCSTRIHAALVAPRTTNS